VFVKGAKTGTRRGNNQRSQLPENGVYYTQQGKDRRLAGAKYHRMDERSMAVGRGDSQRGSDGVGDTGGDGHQTGECRRVDSLSSARVGDRERAKKEARETIQRVQLASRMGVDAAEWDSDISAQRGADGASDADRATGMGVGMAVALGDVAVEGIGGGLAPEWHWWGWGCYG
jgi:hypothetical protein